MRPGNSQLLVVAGAVGDELGEQAGEGFGDRGGRVAEADVHLAVVVAGDVAEGQAEDAAEWLGVEQHEAGGGADPDGAWSSVR